MSIKKFVKCDLNLDQEQALTSLMKDIGEVLFQNSTLVKMLNQNNFQVEEEFIKWSVKDGRYNSQMAQQRQLELALFNGKSSN